ncbi:hypothetical protein, partial [Escherichia coli]|uniref:hypothetical protein n=1 Tax=Escherichia coli TaxID=562 RepID=UPI0039E11EE7
MILSLKESTFGFISTASLSQSSEAVPSHLSLSEKSVSAIFSSRGSGGYFHISVSDFAKFHTNRSL